jgi:hypothetical protein
VSQYFTSLPGNGLQSISNSTYANLASTSINTTSLTTSTLDIASGANFSGSVNFALMPNLPLTQNHIYVGNTQNKATPFAPGNLGEYLTI